MIWEDMKERKCVICGKTFVPKNPKQKMCSDTHYHPCPVCGKPVLTKVPSDINKCCSRKCGQALAQKSREKTYKSKYGSDSLNQIQSSHMYTKTCKWCGKKFKTSQPRQYYCGNDYYKCPVCGKLTKINKDRSNIGKACSKECKRKLTQSTNEYKYGSKEIFESNYFKEKRTSTSIKKYGVDIPSKSDNVKSKCKDTMNSRYGVTYPLQNKDIKKKVEDTNKERYGSEWPMSNDDVKSKAKITFDKRYDGIGFGSRAINERITSSLIEEYGVDSPMKSDEIKEKAANTNLQRYNSQYYNSSDYRYMNLGMTDSQIKLWRSFKEDPKNFILSLSEEDRHVYKLSQTFGISETPIQYIIHENNLYQYMNKSHSYIEDEVYGFVKSVLPPNAKIIRNDRTVISPYELDIYVPDFNFAIEVNPTATHNSSINIFDKEIMPPSYHKNKSLACKEADISLFHLFDYNWENKRSIVESMIQNRLGVHNTKLYARKLRVGEVSYKESSKFLIENHLLGSSQASFRLGLYNGTELVSLMTFGMIRPSQGRQSHTSIELRRFCSKRGYVVYGGASKLFKHALSIVSVNRPQVDTIVSFSDVATTLGNVYKRLGFSENGYVEPSYVWVNPNSLEVINRVSSQKRNLKHLFNDNSIDLSKSEREIMERHRYVRVFDSGMIRWIYKLNR